MGEFDDTRVFYIWGDNGASMEGSPSGTLNELTMQSGIPLISPPSIREARELRRLFWEEAENYDVLPLLGGIAFSFGILPPLGTQTTYEYYGSVQNSDR